MIRLHIIVEGQTEQLFVQKIIAAELARHDVIADARLLGLAFHKGGNVSYERLKKDIRSLLLGDSKSFCSTLLDFYGLKKGFPGELNRDDINNQRKVASIENAIAEDFKGISGDRLIPYIQLHEFEGLLFSNPAILAESLRQPKILDSLRLIRENYKTPEDINDGTTTAPSKQIENLFPIYKKTFHGILAAKAIGLETIRQQCPRFNNWITRLSQLKPLS